MPTRLRPPGPSDQEVERCRATNGGVIDLLRLARQHGELSSVEFHGKRSILVTQPDHVLHVLARQESTYQKTSHRARVLLGYGLVASSGDLWSRQRKLFLPRFTVAGVRGCDDFIMSAAQRVINRWRATARRGERIDLGEHMTFFALDVAWRNISGAPLDDRTFQLLKPIGSIVEQLPSAERMTAELPAQCREALAAIDTMLYGLIARETPLSDTKNSLVHLLIRAARERPELDDKLIRDELITLIAAGYETTAMTLTWTYLTLAEHKIVEDDLRNALRDGADDAVPALVMEVLRLYPAAWLLPRTAVADDVIDGWEVSAGDAVLISPYFTHREPRFWADPEEFRPERFAGGGRDWQTGSYYPFGLGHRLCIGQHIAMREMVTLLSMALREFHVEIDPEPRTVVFASVLRPSSKPFATVHEL